MVQNRCIHWIPQSYTCVILIEQTFLKRDNFVETFPMVVKKISGYEYLMTSPHATFPGIRLHRNPKSSAQLIFKYKVLK